MYGEVVKQIENILGRLIDKNEDAIKDFEKVAENSKDLGVKNSFKDSAECCRRFLQQLKNASFELQLGNTEIEGAVPGVPHRSWMDAKAVFSNDNEESMLEVASRVDESSTKKSLMESWQKAGFPRESKKF